MVKYKEHSVSDTLFVYVYTVQYSIYAHIYFFLRSCEHFGQNHLPFGFVVSATQAKWNHSIGHCNKSKMTEREKKLNQNRIANNENDGNLLPCYRIQSFRHKKLVGKRNRSVRLDQRAYQERHLDVVLYGRLSQVLALLALSFSMCFCLGQTMFK